MLMTLARLLLSLRTAVVLTFALTLILFIGSAFMSAREVYQTIHAVPLYTWLITQPFTVTWWLWCSIGLLVMLTANTLICSFDHLIKKRSRPNWLLVISPQIIHAGFLFMLIAHGISATSSFTAYQAVTEGSLLHMPHNAALSVQRIDIAISEEGYLTDWSVAVAYTQDRSMTVQGRLMPNRPLFFSGVGVYIRDISAFPVRAALLELSYEPGALWALIGGILFMGGTIMLILFKMRREQ